jgi:hypothetical protein
MPRVSLLIKSVPSVRLLPVSNTYQNTLKTNHKMIPNVNCTHVIHTLRRQTPMWREAARNGQRGAFPYCTAPFRPFNPLSAAKPPPTSRHFDVMTRLCPSNYRVFLHKLTNHSPLKPFSPRQYVLSAPSVLEIVWGTHVGASFILTTCDQSLNTTLVSGFAKCPSNPGLTCSICSKP